MRATPASRSRRAIGPVGVLLLLLLLVVVAAAWFAVRVLQLRANLTAARDDIDSARSALAAARFAAIQTDADHLVTHAARARSAVDDPVYRLATHVPGYGEDLSAVGTVARALDDVAGHAVRPLAHGRVLATVQRSGASVSDLLAALEADQPAIQGAAAVAERAERNVQRIRTGTLLGPVRDGIAQARDGLDKLSSLTAKAATAARAVPPLLGAHRDATILMVFQNVAEPRATGGIPGAWGEIRARDGALHLEHYGSDTGLKTLAALPAGVNPELLKVYRADVLFPPNETLTGSWPDAAQLVATSWSQGPGGGRRPDAVLAFDPVGLGAVLKVTGPVTVPVFGEINGSNAADVLLRQIYERFPRSYQKPQRTAVFGAVTAAVFAKITAHHYQPSALLKKLVDLAAEHRVLLWSRDPTQERAWRELKIAGALDELGPADLRVVTSSADGSKLGAFLHTTVTYGRCATDPALAVTLRSSAPLHPAKYAASQVPGLKRSSMRLILGFYMAQSWGVRGLSVDGRTAGFSVDTEDGLRLLRATVDLPRDSTRTLQLRLISNGSLSGIQAVQLGPGATVSSPRSVTGCPVGGHG